ncbi:MAG: marine proteobacterial sortase target protein [Alphaproteobacteria bacterium]|nr:marine proteobacterial sortase target protein [Alphaproteobacteria bacterium]
MILSSLRTRGLHRRVLLAKCAVLLGAVLLNAVVLTALALTAAPAHAQAITQTLTQSAALPAPVELPPVAGLFFRSDQTDTLFAAATLASDVTIQVTGEVARVTVVQHFRNPSKVWLEGIYVFPLPERSAVDRLTMRIGEREVRGRILEKEEAQKVYEKAAAAGKRASLLTSKRPNVFSTSVANIGPGERISIEIEYQDTALFADGTYSYRFPLVVNPRYSPAADLPLVAVPPAAPRPPLLPLDRDRGLQNINFDAGSAPVSHQGDGETQRPAAVRERGRDLFGPVRNPALGKINPISLQVHINAGVPLADISAPNHQIDVLRDEAGGVHVTLANGEIPADRDFVLNWVPVAGAQPQIGLFSESRNGAAHLLVSLLPPASDAWPERTVPRDLVLVLDKSGSMHGPAIARAREAARLALERLTTRDRFNLIVFDNETRRLFSHVQPATRANVQNGLNTLRSLTSGGGTEMHGALTAAFANQAPEGRLRQVVFLTDGSVSNEHALTELIETRLGSTRLFTVGLGSAPNSFFMRRAAEAGRGTFTYIDKPGEVVAKMGALHRKLERPALTDIRLDWHLQAPAAPEVFPAVIPDLYIGDPISFSVRLPGQTGEALSGALRISGRLNNEEWSRLVPLANVKSVAGVAAVWGRAKVADQRAGYPLREPDFANMRGRVVKTALAYQLVTEFTSLVAVDNSEIARPLEEPLETSEIDRNLPAGMSFEKVFGADAFGPGGMRPVPANLLQDASFRQTVGLPQTATPAGLMALLGALLLAVGLLLIALVYGLPRAIGASVNLRGMRVRGIAQ